MATTKFDKPVGTEIDALKYKIPDVPKIGKLLYSGTIAKDASSATITGISKYNLFMAVINGNFIGGPMYGVRFGAEEIRFFGCTLASGDAMSYSYLIMKVSGDNFIGWDTDGIYATKWGDGTTGICGIYGIA